MANHKSAEKRAKQTLVKNARNVAARSRFNTYIRKIESALDSGDKSSLPQLLISAQSELGKATQKGIIHPNTAARKISRLTARVKAAA